MRLIRPPFARFSRSPVGAKRVLYFRAALLILCLPALLVVGLSHYFGLFAYGMLFVGALLLAALWLVTRGIGDSDNTRGIECQGIIWLFLMLGLAGAALLVRLPSSRATVILAATYASFTIVACAIVWRSHGPVGSAFKVGAGVTIGAFVVAWLITSFAHLSLEQARAFVVPDPRLSQQSLSGMRDTRKDVLRQWIADGGPVVAVTLSGGGYRAAAAHAGLLYVLDKVGIPIFYLSTVSGGSIVGAAYSIGWAPMTFKDILEERRPALAADLLNIFSVLRVLLSPHLGSGDIFAKHLRRIYFGGADYQDAGPPVLIINTTDLRTGARQVFVSTSTLSDEGPSTSPTKNDPRHDGLLATAVAASGAFPVFFDPVEIDGSLQADGGVYENLGIAGLLRYSKRAARKKIVVPSPDIVIVSNFSADMRELSEAAARPSPIEVGLLAQDLIYSRMHEFLFRMLTGSPGAGGGPYTVPRSEIWHGGTGGNPWVFLLTPRSGDAPSRFMDCGRHVTCNRDVQNRSRTLLYGVGRLGTIAELSREEVKAAFWVGAKLAHSYVPEICTAATTRTGSRMGQGRPVGCSEFLLPDPPSVPAEVERLAGLLSSK